MSTRARLFVLVLSTPLIAFALIGGVLGRTSMGETSVYQHLRVFEDVVSLMEESYVEKVDVDRVMEGAMRGLVDGLDADSSWLPPAEVGHLKDTPAPGGVGIDLTRQYYMRVVSARDGSPAAKAGLATGDYIRAIDGQSTRDMSVVEGRRRLRGAPGSTVTLAVFRGSLAEPHSVTLTREADVVPDIAAKLLPPDVGYVRAAAFTARTAEQLRDAARRLKTEGAATLVIDLRGTSEGSFEDGIAAARVFVSSGTISAKEKHGGARETVVAASGDGVVTQPTLLLTNNGTSGPAEVFAAALKGANRTELVGERTLGRTAIQQLVALPDGSALWLSVARYLTPSGEAIHTQGLKPDVEATEPEIEFGAARPSGDPILEKALEHLAAKRVA